MKKVININFQGRVIPIEETAYEILKEYIASLRIYFAREEGRDEIINDIESRIAELFSEKLKGGITCITDDDVNSIIAGMGRPEDFAAEDGDQPRAEEVPPAAAAGTASGTRTGRERLYRNADDKILGGVASGLANYLGIDPIITRIVFVLFVGVLFWVYILLWIIVPSKSVQSNITKRLYRSPEQRVLGGVCGGIAAYFNIDVWIPRLIFVLPFILGLISSSFNAFMWDWEFMPRVISGSFGGTMFITYIILWIAVPVAHTAAEKLEMRGEKVDLHSIASTVKEDLQQFKNKAEKWGEEVKSSARTVGKQASESAKVFSSEAGYAARRSGQGLGHALGVIIKAFVIFVLSIVAISLFAAFIGLLFGGVAFMPILNFVFESGFENALAWATLFLFFMIPLVALITWAVRRIMGVRTRRHYLAFTFVGLWILGWLAGIALIISVVGNFKSNARLDEVEAGSLSADSTVAVEVQRLDWKQNTDYFFGMEDFDDFPFFSIGEDSIMLNTVSLRMAKSSDSLYHVYTIRESRGKSRKDAAMTAERIAFDAAISDTTVSLPQGFLVGKNDKYRNQRVRVVIEVPVGKMIRFDRDIDLYDWVSVRHTRDGLEIDEHWDEDDWDRWDMHEPLPGRTYRMTAEGRPEKVADR